jgi:membrane protease YdiL (CAAX protease family)
LISAPDYLVTRTNWAIYAFHQTFAPEFASYFDLSRAWDPWLLLLTFGAFAEEFVFRGLLLRKLMFRYGLHRGIFLTGIVWAAYHFRSDSYSGLSVGGVFFHLARRILICLAMNYVLAWMTLRWKSIIPAGIAHTVSDILVVAGINYQTPWFVSNLPSNPSVSRGIMKLAGEPGDRWPGHRKMAGREESPDTVVVGSQESVTK